MSMFILLLSRLSIKLLYELIYVIQTFHVCKWLKQNLMLYPFSEKHHCVWWILIWSCLLRKTAEPINQLRSVKITLCVEANICTQEREDNQCSVSLPVFFLIPQDKSVSAPTLSLLSHASICLLLSLCVCLSQILVTFRLPHRLSAFLSLLPPHTLCSSPSLQLFIFYFYLSISFCLCLRLPSCCSSSTSLSLPQDCRVYSVSLRLVLLQRRMETCLAVVVTAGLLWE